MNIQQVLDRGGLEAALADQTAAVKQAPADVDARYVLAVLLCFAGDLERAAVHLDTIARLEPDLVMAAGVYRSLLVAELMRRAVFRGEGRPLLPPDCSPSVEERLEAMLALRRGDESSAAERLERACAAENPIAGQLNDTTATDLRDGDDFLGPVLEAYAGGNYLWLPLERVRTLELSKPAHDLDLLWAPATLVDVDGIEASLHLPVLYAETEGAEALPVRFGRQTEWLDRAGLGFQGLGQRVFFTGGDNVDLGLLEIRSLQVASAERSGDG